MCFVRARRGEEMVLTTYKNTPSNAMTAVVVSIPVPFTKTPPLPAHQR
jgi:hypothetical protein